MRVFSRLFVLAIGSLFLTVNVAQANIVIGDIGTQTGGFRASLVHESNKTGSDKTDDQASSSQQSGIFDTTVSPGLRGDWAAHGTGSILTVNSDAGGGGLVEGLLGGTTGGVFDKWGGTGDPDEIRLRWTGGKLKFFNSGHANAAFHGKVGGWLDFDAFIDTGSGFGTSVLSGTFYFFPQTFTTSGEPDPNTYETDADLNVTKFALWGNNWETTSHIWDFLEDELDYDTDGNTSILYADSSITGKHAGIDLSFNFEDEDTPGVPEPTTFLMWSVLGVAGLFATKRRRAKK